MRRINSSRSECMQRSPTGALEITLNYSTDAGTEVCANLSIEGVDRPTTLWKSGHFDGRRHGLECLTG